MFCMTLKQLIQRKCGECGRAPRQEDVAHEIGVHPSALSHWVSGRRSMTLRNACKIARALGVRVEVVNGEFRFERK